MVRNIYKNGSNEASNTNAKLPDLKWQKIAKKSGQKLPKMAKNAPKMVLNYLKCLGKWSKGGQ